MLARWFRSVSRYHWLSIALWLTLSISLANLHSVQVDFDPDNRQAVMERHLQILGDEGKAPWAYRLAMPYVAKWVFTLTTPFFGHNAQGLAAAYVCERWFFIFVFLVLFQRWLERWIEPTWAFAGTILAAALHPITFLFYTYQPDSPPDLAVWTAVAVCTVYERFGWLPWLVAFGALNRETAVFAIVVHVALRLGHEPLGKLAARTAQLFVCWIVPFLGVRYVIGRKEWSVDVFDLLLHDNLAPAWIFYVVCFLAPLLIAPLVGPRDKVPIELRRMGLWLALTYVPLQFVFGRIREVRLFLPLVLPLVPMLLVAMKDALARHEAKSSP